MLIQLPLANSLWANVKDWSWPQLAFAFAVIFVILSFSLARRLLRTGTQAFEGEQKERNDTVSILREQLNAASVRADKAHEAANARVIEIEKAANARVAIAEARADRAVEERDDIQQELNGFKWMEKRPALLRERADELEALKAEPPAVVNKGNILVVEDNKDARQVLVLTLQFLLYSVKEAPNAMKAIELCAQARAHEPFDLILLDESMPYMSGQQFVRLLREGGDQTRVAFLTAHGDNIDRDEMKMLGITQIWQKGLTTDEIAQRLNETLQTEKPASN